jgi:hypothetical protein
VEYVDRRLDKLNKEEEFRKTMDKLIKDGNPELKNAIEKLEVNLAKHIREVVLPNLEKFAKSEKFKELSEGEQNKIKDLITQFKTPG